MHLQFCVAITLALWSGTSLGVAMMNLAPEYPMLRYRALPMVQYPQPVYFRTFLMPTYRIIGSSDTPSVHERPLPQLRSNVGEQDAYRRQHNPRCFVNWLNSFTSTEKAKEPTDYLGSDGSVQYYVPPSPVPPVVQGGFVSSTGNPVRYGPGIGQATTVLHNAHAMENQLNSALVADTLRSDEIIETTTTTALEPESSTLFSVTQAPPTEKSSNNLPPVPETQS